MSNKAFRIISPEPGEIFLMDRGGNKPDRMVICKQAKMSWKRRRKDINNESPSGSVHKRCPADVVRKGMLEINGVQG